MSDASFDSPEGSHRAEAHGVYDGLGAGLLLTNERASGCRDAKTEHWPAFGTHCVHRSRELIVVANRHGQSSATLEHAEVEHLLGGSPRIALEDIVRHPRLPEARKLYLDRFLEVYGGDPFL